MLRCEPSASCPTALNASVTDPSKGGAYAADAATPSTFAIVSPIVAGLSATVIPAAFSAAIFVSAVPSPPVMIAPAWPMRLPGGAVRPAMKATTGFFTFCLTNAAACVFVGAADLADHDDRVGLRVLVEQVEAAR